MRSRSGADSVLPIQPAFARPLLCRPPLLWQLQAAPEEADRRSTAEPFHIRQSRPIRRPLAEEPCLGGRTRSKTSDQSPPPCATARSPHRNGAQGTESPPSPS